MIFLNFFFKSVSSFYIYASILKKTIACSAYLSSMKTMQAMGFSLS